MPRRITPAQTNALFDVVRTTAQRHGVAHADRWAFKNGSGTYGYHYAIVEVDPETHGQSTVVEFGVTRGEAWTGLKAMLDAYHTLDR